MALVQGGTSRQVELREGLTVYYYYNFAMVPIFLYRVKKNLKFTRWSLFLSQEAYWSTRFLLMFLFSTGLDVDACTKSGVTPLMMTARQCSTGRCEMLIEAGANLNIRDINQDTALALSVCCRCEHNTRLLIVNGADLNTGNEG